METFQAPCDEGRSDYPTVSNMAAVERIAGLIEQLPEPGYDLRQPTPEDHADHAAYPIVVDLLCTPENCLTSSPLSAKGCRLRGKDGDSYS